MIVIRYIALSLLASGLFSCSTQDKKLLTKIEIRDRALYPKTNLSPLLDSLRPAKQSFTINGEKDTLIVGRNGTSLTILKNTFVNRNGQLAGTVTINLLEVHSLADIINSNLQTTSGDAILQTGGMLFIDAKENNESLEIIDGKSIQVELMSGFKAPGMRIFEGNFNGNGKMDWTAPRSLERYLIPIPLILLDFGEGGLECQMTEKQLKYLTDVKFENTFIATREFEERTKVLNLASCRENKDLCQRLIDIYMANINKPLFVSDSLVAECLLKNYASKIDTLRKFDNDETGWMTYFYQLYNAFAKERLVGVIDFGKLGVSETTTTEELIAKGHSQIDAERYIAFFRQRKQILRTREDKKQTSRLASCSFSISKMGWFNVDRFIDDRNADVSTFLVQLKTNDTLGFASVSLVIPGLNAAIMSTRSENNTYSFTKKEEGYRKLPVGEDAIIVAFSYKDNKPYFGQKKIVIPKDGLVELTLNATDERSVQREIAKLTVE